jgi:hypothetical protein
MHFHNICEHSCSDDGLYIHPHGITDWWIDIRRVDGGPFDLIELDVLWVWSPGGTDLPSFTASNGSFVGAPWTLGTRDSMRKVARR